MSNLPPFQTDKLLKEVSTFGIGGKARLFTQVSSVEQMQQVLIYCKEQALPFFILGKGSNCLFDDQGLNALVIHNKISYLEMQEGIFDVGAGFSFSLLGAKSAKSGFTGLEFASGIPATVGGAIFMNAGANGRETAQCLTHVSFVNEEGELLHLEKKDLEFGYRHSCFQKRKGAIVSAKFALIPSLQARDSQLSIIDYRKKTQPYKEASIGCIFRNPDKDSAGRIIEQGGLKGLSVGDAEVSSIHANFIVNKGKASSQDVLHLIALIQEKVKALTGVTLEMEARCIPYNLT